jgi:hypothetical protein
MSNCVVSLPTILKTLTQTHLQFSECTSSVDYPWSEERTRPAQLDSSNVVKDPVCTAGDVTRTQDQDASAGANQHDESPSAADNSTHVAGNEPRTQHQAGSADAGDRDEVPNTVDDPDGIAGVEPRTQDNTDAGRRERSRSAARDPTHTVGDASRAQGQDASAGASQRNDISEQSSHTLQNLLTKSFVPLKMIKKICLNSWHGIISIALQGQALGGMSTIRN